MVGRMLFRKRSLLLPKTFVKALSKFIIALSLANCRNPSIFSVLVCRLDKYRSFGLSHSCAARDSKLPARMRASEVKGHKNQPTQNTGVVIDGGIDDARP